MKNYPDENKIFDELEHSIELYIEKAKNALIESELRFNKMFIYHDSIMLLIDPENGDIIEANISASKFYGYSMSELCSMNINQINNLSPDQVVYEYTNAANEKNNCFEFPHILSDKTLKIVEVHSSPIDYKGNKYLFSIINDITERKKLETELNIKTSLLEAQLKSNIEAIAIADLNKNFQINQQYINLFELPDNIINTDFDTFLKYISELMKNPSEFLEKVTNLYNSSETIRDETELKNGKIFDRYSSPILCENNKVYGRIWSFRDITDIKNAEKKVKKKNEKLKKLNTEKDTLLSIISHDLRGSLSVIMESTKMLANKDISLSDKERSEWLLELSNTAKNSFELLNELLEWSKIIFIKINTQKLNLKYIVDNSLILLAEIAKNKSIELIVNIPEEQIICADQNILQTIIRNLISNAIKFTKNGSVTISSQILSVNSFSISIKDTGIGMTEKIKNNLFNNNVYTARKGTNGEISNGIGLLLCKDLIEKHNGILTIESEENKGSTFTFNIQTKKHEH